MWEVYASESAWAEIVRAVCCFESYLLAKTPRKCKEMTRKAGRREGNGMHTAFVCPLIPLRVARYVLRLVLLLLLALLLAALIEHLFEELELCEGYARQRAYQG